MRLLYIHVCRASWTLLRVKTARILFVSPLYAQKVVKNVHGRWQNLVVCESVHLRRFPAICLTCRHTQATIHQHLMMHLHMSLHTHTTHAYISREDKQTELRALQLKKSSNTSLKPRAATFSKSYSPPPSTTSNSHTLPHSPPHTQAPPTRQAAATGGRLRNSSFSGLLAPHTST